MNNTINPLLRQEIRQTFRSLRYRNFRLYFLGQLVSLAGTWMQSVALSWLVYRMTHSPFMLGVTECASLLPMLIFGLTGGWLADRLDRKKILLITQTLAMCQAVVLAFLTLSNNIQLWQAICLTALLGIVNAFEVSSRQAFLVDLVEKDDLVNAVSLNSSLFSSARTIGPALAGIIVSLSGEGVCFAINALSYLTTIAAISFITVPQHKKVVFEQSRDILMRDAFQFAMKDTTIRHVLFLVGMTSFFAWQYSVLMPSFASDILHGGVRLLGILRAGAGCGAFIAALAIANRGRGELLQKAVGYASIVLSLFLCAFALSTNALFSLLLVVGIGLFMTSILSGGHSLIQLAVHDNLRGRVMSIYMTIMLGVSPIGSLAIGFMASRYGVQITICLCAFVSMAMGILYLVLRQNQSKVNT